MAWRIFQAGAVGPADASRTEARPWSRLRRSIVAMSARRRARTSGGGDSNPARKALSGPRSDPGTPILRKEQKCSIEHLFNIVHIPNAQSPYASAIRLGFARNRERVLESQAAADAPGGVRGGCGFALRRCCGKSATSRALSPREHPRALDERSTILRRYIAFTAAFLPP